MWLFYPMRFLYRFHFCLRSGNHILKHVHALWTACPGWARLSSCARTYKVKVDLHCPSLLLPASAHELDLYRACGAYTSFPNRMVPWMLFFNSQSQICRVEDEDTDNPVSGSSLRSRLGLGDRWHIRIWHAVSKILTSRFKQVKIFSGPVTFLWYSLCLTLGLQDILADQLSRDISNIHKELLKYLVLYMSCEIQNCLWHAITINERQRNWKTWMLFFTYIFFTSI